MGFKGTALAIGVFFSTLGMCPQADAARPDRHQAPANTHARTALPRPPQAPLRHGAAKPGRPNLHLTAISGAHAASRPGHGRRFSVQTSYGGISCVPYARQVTGMNISGNGWQWWGNAAGSYARGYRPEAGSVLAFRSSGGMRSGHVAVVSRVLAPRHVLIDHANWGGPGIRRGSVMQDVHVIDVSEANDWTDVRVQIGRDGESFGRSYPTYGFIYNRPDTNRYIAQGEQRQLAFEEVAEAPEPANAPRAGQRNASRRTTRR